MWQDTRAGGGKERRQSRSEVLIGEVATSVTEIAFCVDNLRTRESDPDIVRHVFAVRSINERLHAAKPSRLELFDGSLSCHMPRVPRTEVELRFYVQLLCDLATEIERLPVDQ